MKITDYGIIFCATFFCFIIALNIRNDLMYTTIYTMEEMNNLSDNVVVDSLKKAYKGVDNNLNPIIDKNILISYFLEEISYLFFLNDNYKEANNLEKYIDKIIYIEGNGYYVYKDSKWSIKIPFEDTKHVGKVAKIIRSLENEFENKIDGNRLKVLFPLNSGEAYSQTLSDYGFVVLFNNNIGKYNSKQYKKYYLSVASLKKSH